MSDNIWRNYIIEWFANQKPHLDFEVQIRDKLNDNGTKGIALGMKEIGSQVEELHFALTSGKFKLPGSKSLGEAFAALSNVRLINFKMVNMKVQDDMTKSIMGGIAQCSELNSLQIYFYKMDFGQMGCRYIGESLSLLKKITNIDLQFDANNISSLGLSELCQGMSNCANLQSLRLIVCFDSIKDEGMSGFYSLFSKAKRLEDIALKLCPTNITPAGAKVLKNALNEAKQLKKVSFQFVDNSLNCLGWKEIFEGFQGYQSLLELQIKVSDFGHYKGTIQEEGCKGLKTSLCTLQSLYKLDLDLSFGLIENNALKHIAEGLEKAENLSELKIILYSNTFNSEGLELLFHGISKLEKLTSLQIGQTQNQSYHQYIGNGIFSSLQRLQQIRILQLTELYLYILPEHMPNFISCFSQLTNLMDLRLNLNYSCYLTIEDMIEVLECLGQLKSLNTLYVHFPLHEQLRYKQQEYNAILIKRTLKLKRIVRQSIYTSYQYVKLN